MPNMAPLYKIKAVATPSEKLADIMPGMILIIGLFEFLGFRACLRLKASSILTGANAFSMDHQWRTLCKCLRD